jgi:hypothetical protein
MELHAHSLLSVVQDRSSIMRRLAEVDLIIKQTQSNLHETLELIDRLREHYLRIQEKLSDAEREQAALLTEASRFFDASDLPAESGGERGRGAVRPEQLDVSRATGARTSSK